MTSKMVKMARKPRRCGVGAVYEARSASGLWVGFLVERMPRLLPALAAPRQASWVTLRFPAYAAGLPNRAFKVTACAEEHPKALLLLRFDTNKHKRNGWHASALTNNIVKLTLIVSDPGTHLTLQGFHGKNFDSHVNAVAYIKSKMFDE